MATITWSADKAAEIQRWREDNNKSLAECGAKYGTSGSAIGQGLRKWLEVKSKKRRKYKTKTKVTPESFDLLVPDEPSRMVAIAIVPIASLAELLGVLNGRG